MAGIGFELRKYLTEDSFTGTLKAYGFAGLISAGPWVLSILGVMLIGIVALSQKVGGREVEQFTHGFISDSVGYSATGVYAVYRRPFV